MRRKRRWRRFQRSPICLFSFLHISFYLLSLRRRRRCRVCARAFNDDFLADFFVRFFCASFFSEQCHRTRALNEMCHWKESFVHDLRAHDFFRRFFFSNTKTDFFFLVVGFMRRLTDFESKSRINTQVDRHVGHSLYLLVSFWFRLYLHRRTSPSSTKSCQKIDVAEKRTQEYKVKYA